MRRALALVALLALASTAGAQALAPQMPEGTQMPDPRQMSGIPRPDQAVAPGLLTVKILLGEMGHTAPAGTQVELVAVKSDGTVAKISQPVNDEGRAEFPNLARDGGTAYYAFCMLGDDRLESEAIVLPPMVGVRLMLVGRKTDKTGNPQGPPVDDQRKNVPPDDPVVPAGDVLVAVRGPAGAADVGQKVMLREVTEAGIKAPPPREEKATGDEDKQQLDVIFKDVPADPRQVFVVETVVNERIYRSQPFQMAPKAGTMRSLIVHDKMLFAMQGGAQLDDEDLWFEVQLAVANLTGAPYDTKGGVLIPLPEGFLSATLKDDSPGEKIRVEPDRGVLWTGIVPPGQQQVIVQFRLPVVDGHVHVSMEAPLGIFDSQLALEKFPGAVVSPATGATTAAPRITHGEDGRDFYVIGDISVKPGGSLSLDITGLPRSSRMTWWARVLVGILVLMVVLTAAFFAVRPGAKPPVEPTENSSQRDLERRRDRLYDQLVALERSRRAHGGEDRAYAAQRKSLVAKLVMVHREIEELGDGHKAAEAHVVSAAGELCEVRLEGVTKVLADTARSVGSRSA